MDILNKITVLDVETTGCNPMYDEIIEIGAVKITNGKIVDKYNKLIKPHKSVPQHITNITNITNGMLQNMDDIRDILPEFLGFCGEDVIVGHNVLFDYKMIKAQAIKQNLGFEHFGIDTLYIARKYLSHLPSRRLGALCEYYGIDLKNAHRAFNDAEATYQLLVNLVQDFYEEAAETFNPQKLMWKVPKQSAITQKQKKYLLYLLELHNVELDKKIDELSKSEASKVIDGIIREYGRW